MVSKFSGSIKAFCIRKLTYKEKTSSTRFLRYKRDGNKFVKLTFTVTYLWHTSEAYYQTSQKKQELKATPLPHIWQVFPSWISLVFTGKKFRINCT